MKSGLYALASLSGAPLDRMDRAILGLADTTGAACEQAGFVAVAIDSDPGGQAASQAVLGSTRLLFLGHLDEPAALAAELNDPDITCPAGLALRALRKWGVAAMAHMPGEWSLLQWDTESRELLAGVSQDLRDVMRFATDGRRVAIAPDIRRLGRLSWVGHDFNPTGLALWTARTPLRLHYLKDQTILRHVTAVEPGTFRRFVPDKPVETFAPPPPPAIPVWEGSFEEALRALENTARQVIRETLARQGTVALMLSGGLDSSILVWLAAEERRAGQDLFCLTSVAAPGSGLVDERNYSQMVARTLGLPIKFVTPAENADPYRPTPQTFAYAEGPSQSPRHYLYDTLYQAARDGGAGTVMDGTWGELTLTRRVEFLTPLARLRAQVRAVRNDVRGRMREPHWPDAGFHVRLSRDVLAGLPADIRGRRMPVEGLPLLYPDAELGLGPGHEKAGVIPTIAVLAGLRHLIPYRDRRLQLLMAGMPAAFTFRDGLSRAVGRAMLKDRLPDEIRLRTQPVPFSPDYGQRLQRNAGYVLERMENYRRSGAGDWIDLRWLARELKEWSRNQTAPVAGQFKVQLTAMMAEFLVQWAAPDKTE